MTLNETLSFIGLFLACVGLMFCLEIWRHWGK